MNFTFGIITGRRDCDESNKNDDLSLIIDSIRNQSIPNYEIVIVGHCDLESSDIVNIDFDDGIKDNWITKKKNIITEAAQYDNIVYLHDYIIFEPGWYDGFKLFGNTFDVCSNIILDRRDKRWVDWTLWYEDVLFMNVHDAMPYLLPYDVTDLSKYMYIAGSYWIAKKWVMQDIPLNEELAWGQGEDVEWSKRVRDKYTFSFNPMSTIKFLKDKDCPFNDTTPQIIEVLRGRKND